MALAQALGVYSKSSIQLFSVLNARCHCGRHWSVLTSARLKDIEDKLHLIRILKTALSGQRGDATSVLPAQGTAKGSYFISKMKSRPGLRKNLGNSWCKVRWFHTSAVMCCKENERTSDDTLNEKSSVDKDSYGEHGDMNTEEKPLVEPDSGKEDSNEATGKGADLSGSSKTANEVLNEATSDHVSKGKASVDKHSIVENSNMDTERKSSVELESANEDSSEAPRDRIIGSKKANEVLNDTKATEAETEFTENERRTNEDLEGSSSARKKETKRKQTAGESSVKTDKSAGTSFYDKFLDLRSYTLPWNIERFLQENDLPYEESYTGYYIVCPKFGKVAMKRKKDEHRIYINYMSGYFKCNACGKTGNWSQLQDNVTHILLKKGRKKSQMECFQGLQVKDPMGKMEDKVKAVENILEEAKDLASADDDEFENILSVFDWQGITKSTFKRYRVKYIHQDNKYNVYFPIVSTNKKLLGARVYTAVITEEEDVKLEPVITIPKGMDSGIFGWQTKPEPETKNYYGKLVITSGEIQAMAISQGTTLTAFSIKDVDRFPHEHVPLLEKFEMIYLWLGTDLKSWESSKLIAKKLNEKRCLLFRPASVNEMPLEFIQTEEDIRQKLKMARPLSHEAIHTFEHLKLEVYKELSQHEHVTGIKWKRYSKLNDILKGFRQGELTVLTGPTGSGKTTFLSEYGLDLCMQGVTTLWGSFEICNIRLVKMMLQQFAGKNMTLHLDEFDTVAKDFMELPMYFMAYHGQQNVDQVIDTMRHAVYVHNIQHVILDNLQFMVGMDQYDAPVQNIFLRQDRIVSQFRKFATDHNCHVTIIIHPRKVDRGEELSISSIFGSAKVSQESDNILLIQDNRLTKPGGKKYLQISKNRFDGDLGVMVLTFDKETLGFTMNPKKKP